MNYKFHFIIFLLLALFFSRTNAQSLLLETRVGEVYASSLDSIQKLSFLNNDLVFNMSNNTTSSFSLSDIKRLYFDLTTGFESNEGLVSISQLSVFPNPVIDFLQINPAPDQASQFTIFSIHGERLIQSQISPAANSIDVSRLKKGLYFLNINSQTIKFIKQ